MKDVELHFDSDPMLSENRYWRMSVPAALIFFNVEELMLPLHFSRVQTANTIPSHPQMEGQEGWGTEAATKCRGREGRVVWACLGCAGGGRDSAVVR